MNPTLTNQSEEADVYRFTLGGLNVSIANAIRRTILSEIPITVIRTETYQDNQCNITINTSRLHNEILKQILSCIPIHITDMDLLPNKYVLEVDVANDTDATMFVTTEQFRIKNKLNGNYLTKEETKKIFPPNQKTNCYIDFARLRPKISDVIPGEHLKLSAEFSVANARVDGAFNVVSKCSYGNTPDIAKANTGWEAQEAKLRSLDAPSAEIEFQKRNYYLLDAQRHFIADSFDFVIQTVGIYENKALLVMANQILVDKFSELIKEIDEDTLHINHSETTMEFGYDIILNNEDYTVGKVVEYLLYEKHYQGDKILSFCGFKKLHPHDTTSIVRVAFNEQADKNTVKQYLRAVCIDAQDIFKKIGGLF